MLVQKKNVKSIRNISHIVENIPLQTSIKSENDNQLETYDETLSNVSNTPNNSQEQRLKVVNIDTLRQPSTSSENPNKHTPDTAHEING